MEASYGKEPFDLRLLLLRLGRNLWEILALTILGTVLLGGGYYVKNVLLQPDPGYAASSTYKVEYVENPNAAGAYYINEATWNSLSTRENFWMVWRLICRKRQSAERPVLRQCWNRAETAGSKLCRLPCLPISVFR